MKVVHVCTYSDPDKSEVVAIVKVTANYTDMRAISQFLSLSKAYKATNALRRWLTLRLLSAFAKKAFPEDER